MAASTHSLAAIGPNTLVKALKSNHTHYGHTYKMGLNVSLQPLSEQECGPGGLYGCTLKDLFLWVTLYSDTDTVAIVEIPADAQTMWFDTKFKASALVITSFLPLHIAMELALQHGADVHVNREGRPQGGAYDPALRMVKINSP
jgi:hypothetical protein